MRTQQLIFLNFWESKQLEYWLNDNYPDCRIRSLYDNWSSPEEEEWYAIEGNIDVDLECLLKLKYGNKLKVSNAGIRYGQN
jgi:asparagine synthetase A